MFTYLVMQITDGVVVPQLLHTTLTTEQIGEQLPINRHVFLLERTGDVWNVAKWAGAGFSGFNTVSQVTDIGDLI